MLLNLFFGVPCVGPRFKGCGGAFSSLGDFEIRVHCTLQEAPYIDQVGQKCYTESPKARDCHKETFSPDWKWHKSDKSQDHVKLTM